MPTVIFKNPHSVRSSVRALLAGAVLVGLAVPALAQMAGEVEYARGVGTAQSQGQAPRALGHGLQLKEGDRLTTAQDSTAIVKFSDGTRMTVRPNSEVVVQQFQFKADAPQSNSLVMQLLRGGLRAVTGLISKGSPDAAKIRTSTATIGIRGTDFDARLCAADCKVESARVPAQARPNAAMASAKLTASQGELYAVDAQGARHRLVDGGSVYPGDVVESTTSARGVLIFRDESRVTVGGGTQVRVDAFTFDEKNPKDGKFLVSLLKGSLRALTGLIGKVNHRNVGFVTPTATIGIRGTGLDLDCASTSACSFYTWLGTIEVTPQGQTALQVLQAGEGLFVGPQGIRPLTAPTLNNLPRPDSVPVNMQQLFSSGGPAVDEEGLYVYVRDGHVEVATSSGALHLGRGETGFANGSGQVGRPTAMPLFIQFDPVPMPNSSNPQLLGLLRDLRLVSNNVCR